MGAPSIEIKEPEPVKVEVLAPPYYTYPAPERDEYGRWINYENIGII